MGDRNRGEKLMLPPSSPSMVMIELLSLSRVNELHPIKHCYQARLLVLRSLRLTSSSLFMLLWRDDPVWKLQLCRTLMPSVRRHHDYTSSFSILVWFYSMCHVDWVWVLSNSGKVIASDAVVHKLGSLAELHSRSVAGLDVQADIRDCVMVGEDGWLSSVKVREGDIVRQQWAAVVRWRPLRLF